MLRVVAHSSELLLTLKFTPVTKPRAKKSKVTRSEEPEAEPKDIKTEAKAEVEGTGSDIEEGGEDNGHQYPSPESEDGLEYFDLDEI